MSFYSTLTSSLHRVQDGRASSSGASDYALQTSADFGNLYWATVSLLSQGSLLDYVTHTREGDKCEFHFARDSWYSDTGADVTVAAGVTLSLVEGKGVAVVAIFGLSRAQGFTDTIRGYVSEGDLAQVIVALFKSLSYTGKARYYYIDAWDDFSIALSNISEHPGFASAVEDAAASQSLEYPFKGARLRFMNKAGVFESLSCTATGLTRSVYASLAKEYPALAQSPYEGGTEQEEFVVKAIIEASSSYEDMANRLNRSGLGTSTWKVIDQSSSRGALTYTDPFGHTLFLFIYPKQALVSDSAELAEFSSTEEALSNMYDELTDRALRWYRIEFTDITRRSNFFTVDFNRSIIIPTSKSRPVRNPHASVLCDVCLRVDSADGKKLQATVTVGMQSISDGVSYESEYAGSGYINTVRATLESPAQVNKFIESFLSLLGSLQADGYDYDHYADQVEKFAGKVSPKSAVSDAAGAKDSRREFSNSLTEDDMFGAYRSIVAQCTKKGLLSVMSFSADSDGAHIHLAHPTRLTDTDEECTISGSIDMIYQPWQGVEVVVSYGMAPVYSQFNLETHAYLQTQDGLSAFVRLAVNYLESLASDGQTRAFFVDVSDDMDRDLRKLSERLGFIQNLGEVSDSLSQEAALSIVREHADEIMRAANIPYTKVTSVTPWGDVWVFRYLNKAGVPMAVNFGRNGEGSSMGRSIAVKSRVIRDLLSAAEK